MSKKPPLLPSEALRRTQRVARFDGTSVLVLSGLFAIASAASQDKAGTIIGLLVAGAGAIELHGFSLLQTGNVKGMKWLVFSQLCLLVMILGYAEFKLQHVDMSVLHQLWSTLNADDRQQQLLLAGATEDEYLKGLYTTCYRLVIVLTVLFQGGMTLYYLRRRRPIAVALTPASS
jgi:hypothetical protein